MKYYRVYNYDHYDKRYIYWRSYSHYRNGRISVYNLLFAGAARTRGPFNLTMGTNDAIDTAFAFPSASIIPLHYEGWKHFTQNENDLERAFEAIGIRPFENSEARRTNTA
ncbi:MAG TPA: hypothetical protein VGH64_16630 [Puia sp.]|jgi:hypothetical protein